MPGLGERDGAGKAANGSGGKNGLERGGPEERTASREKQVGADNCPGERNDRNEESGGRDMKKKQFGEMIRFAVTGGLCFLVEFACLIALKEGLGMDTLIATPIAFLISVMVNYAMCVLWVWPGTKGKGNEVRIGFLITSVIGLFLNEGLMLLFRLIFGEEQILMTVAGRGFSMYMMNKILATMLVMIWNYFTKKAILQSDFLAKWMHRKDRE